MQSLEFHKAEQKDSSVLFTRISCNTSLWCLLSLVSRHKCYRSVALILQTLAVDRSLEMLVFAINYSQLLIMIVS